MSMRNWDDLQRAFRKVVALRRHEQTLDQVADTIPVGKRTVYRILSGEVKQPSLAVRDCVERFVEKGERLIGKACQMAPPVEVDPADGH